MSDETETEHDEPASIYLAGPVRDAPDGGRQWREQLVWDHGTEHNLLNPLDKYNIPVEDLTVVDGISDPENDDTVGVDDIVQGDIEMLEEADGVLVGYSDVGRMVGTPMEVMWARQNEMPVVIWIRDDTEMDELSPWFRSMATALTNSVELAFSHVERHRDGVEW